MIKKGETKVRFSPRFFYICTVETYKINRRLMKQMKIAVIAMLAVLMGTTFTSCLNSDNGTAEYTDIVTIDYLGHVISDYGYRLEVQNPSAMQSTDKTYPDRAMIAYNRVDGEDYSEGKSSYKVYFTGYYAVMYIGETSTEEVESVTKINALGADSWASGNYLNIGVNISYDKSIEPGSDLKLYPYEVKNGVLHCKLVHTVKVEGTNTSSLYMSFPLPSKTNLSSQFEGLNFTGDGKNIIDIVVVAEGTNGDELKSNTIKAILQN
jgi:hypothetical protein